jgi:ABC-type glutathione transport system ATPase component
VLELQDVTIAYGHHDVVRGVDLVVRPGQTVGLVGESGSGKTSIAKAAVGLNALKSGRILVDGKTVCEAGKRVRHPSRLGLQMVFQDPRSSLNPRMRVRDTLLESVRLRPGPVDPQVRVAEVAAKIDLTDQQLDRFPHQLSGGQLQRIAIARALVAGADHLLLDEVTASLDVSVQARILNFLRSLQRELGFSMLYISHDLSVVRYLSDYIYVMRGGVIAEHGPAEQVFAHPTTDYTRLLLDSVPELDGSRWRAPASAATPPVAEPRKEAGQ